MAIVKGRVQIVPGSVNNMKNDGKSSRVGELQVVNGQLAGDTIDIDRGVKQGGDLG